ncbi:FK506-binding protein 5-like [Cocos nucifera]|uniref:FK506-binding protein 5-like n=1 Tax=Cocos nucifera TaxID=13894 RepID=A0A8K0NDJ8_COCNU|nr:FK506-binding protein 5-like [Cocos nucifera]
MGNEMGNSNVTGLHGSATEQEDTEAMKESSNSLVMLNNIDGLKGAIDDLAAGKQASSKTPKAAIMSDNVNDSKSKDPSNLSVEFNKLHEKHMVSAYDDPSATDDNLIQKQMSEGREEEQIKASLNTLSRNGETLTILSVDVKNNKQEEPTSMSCNESFAEDIMEERASNEDSAGSDGRCDKLGNQRGESMNEGTVIKEIPADESGSCGEGALINSNVVELKYEENKEQQLPEFDIVANESTPVQQKNSLSNESINSVYLDAADSEIKSLIIVDDPEEVEKSPEMNPRKNGTNLNLTDSDHYKGTLKKETMKDDIKGESIASQLRAIDPNQEEKQENKDGGLEESVIEQAAQIDKTKNINSTQEKQQDYTSSLMSEEQNKYSEGEIKIVQTGTIVSVIDYSVTDNKHEENMEHSNEGSCKENKLEDNKSHEKGLSELSSSLSDPVATSSIEMVNKSEDLNETQKSEEQIIEECKDSDSETNVLKDNDINGKRFFTLSSNLLDPVDTASKEMMEETETRKTAGEKSELAIDDRIKDVPDATVSEEEHAYEINLETGAPPSPPTELSDVNNNNLILPHLVSPDCFQEFECKQTTEESETDIKIDSLNNVSECLAICSRLPNQTDKTTVTVFELENKEQIPYEINPSTSQMRTQANEVPKFENSESVVDFAMQSWNEEQECSSRSHAAVLVSASDLKELESSGRFATESNQEKLNGWTDEATEAGYCLEKSIVESEISAPQSQIGGSEEIPLLPPAESMKCLTDLSESCEYGAPGNSVNNIGELGVKNEKSKQDSFLCPDKTATGVVSGFEKSVAETDKNITRYQTTANQEIICKIGAGTQVSILEASSEESDKSPLLFHKKPMECELPTLERSDSGKLKSPLLSLMNEEASVVKSLEKKVVVLKKDVDEVWRSPVKKLEATSPRGRGKHKPRSTLFSNCMCCTTAIN